MGEDQVATSGQFLESMRLVRRGAAVDSATARALFALANGLVGVEGVADECSGAPGAYLPDAYVRRPITYHESFPGYASATDTRIACPSPVLLRIEIDGLGSLTNPVVAG